MKRIDRFSMGIAAAAALRSLYEDAMGQQSMIEIYQHHWISAWWSVPLAAVLLVVVSVVLFLGEVNGQ